MTGSKAKLPADARPPFDVYVNGVPQQEGSDYRRVDDYLVFNRSLAKEGKLGFWRWLIGAFGVGTYRSNDTVDIRYEVDGRPRVATGLNVEPSPPAT